MKIQIITASLFMFLISINTLLAKEVKFYCPTADEVLNKMRDNQDKSHLSWDNQGLKFGMTNINTDIMKPTNLKSVESGALSGKEDFGFVCKYKTNNDYSLISITAEIIKEEHGLINCNRINVQCDDPAICPVICTSKAVEKIK